MIEHISSLLTKENMQVIGLTLTVILSSVALYKVLLRPICKKTKNKFANVKLFFKKLSQAITSIEFIEKEFRTNGGSTLRDKIDIIDTRLTFIENRDSILLEEAAFGIAICDSYGNHEDVNRTYCRITGATKEELTGHGWKNFFPQDKLQPFINVMSEAFEANRKFGMNQILTTIDGEYVCCHISGHPLARLNKETNRKKTFMIKILVNDSCPSDGGICDPRCRLRTSAFLQSA